VFAVSVVELAGVLEAATQPLKAKTAGSKRTRNKREYRLGFKPIRERSRPNIISL
jgi:hypothetical protein